MGGRNGSGPSSHLDQVGSLTDGYPGPGNQGQKRYEQKNVAWRCDGTDSTTWAGTTVGTIVFGGETFYTRVYQEPVDKDCGA